MAQDLLAQYKTTPLFSGFHFSSKSSQTDPYEQAAVPRYGANKPCKAIQKILRKIPCNNEHKRIQSTNNVMS